MARKYIWTVQIEIDAVEVEKHLTFGNDLAFNDRTATDMVADGLLQESPGDSFSVKSIKVQKPDSGSIAFSIQLGESHLKLVK